MYHSNCYKLNLTLGNGSPSVPGAIKISNMTSGSDLLYVGTFM